MLQLEYFFKKYRFEGPQVISRPGAHTSWAGPDFSSTGGGGGVW